MLIHFPSSANPICRWLRRRFFAASFTLQVSLYRGTEVTQLTVSPPFQPLIWVTSTKGRIVLGTLGIALDYLTKYTIGIVIFESRRQLKKERMRPVSPG